MDRVSRQLDNRLPIGIDIDNVIAASDLKIRQLIKRYFGVDAPQSAITDWHYHRSLPITLQNEQFIFDKFHDSDCLDVRLLNGARQSLDVISSRFQIYLITSRPPSTESITKDWLHKKRIHYDQLFFLQDKVILAPQLHFIVEDNLETAISFVDSGVPVFLFDYPWNRSYTNPILYRVKGWPEVLRNLIQLKIIPQVDIPILRDSTEILSSPIFAKNFNRQ